MANHSKAPRVNAPTKKLYARYGHGAQSNLGLNETDLAFCNAFVRHGRVEPAISEIFPHVPPESRRKAGENIMKRPAIQAQISISQSNACRQAEFTLIDHLHELARLRDLAVGDKDFPSAIKAEELRGRAAGFYVERAQVTGANNGPIQFETMTSEDRVRVARSIAFAMELGAQTIAKAKSREASDAA